MAPQIEALAAGMNEEIKRQGVVLEAYVRRIAVLEAALRTWRDHHERVYDDCAVVVPVHQIEALIGASK